MYGSSRGRTLEQLGQVWNSWSCADRQREEAVNWADIRAHTVVKEVTGPPREEPWNVQSPFRIWQFDGKGETQFGSPLEVKWHFLGCKILETRVHRRVGRNGRHCQAVEHGCAEPLRSVNDSDQSGGLQGRRQRSPVCLKPGQLLDRPLIWKEWCGRLEQGGGGAQN